MRSHYQLHHLSFYIPLPISLPFALLGAGQQAAVAPLYFCLHLIFGCQWFRGCLCCCWFLFLVPISLAGGSAAADCGCRIVPADKLLVEYWVQVVLRQYIPGQVLYACRASGWYEKMKHMSCYAHCSLEANGGFSPFSSQVRQSIVNDTLQMCNWLTIGLCDRKLFHMSKVLVCWIFLNVVTRNGAEAQDRTEKSPLTTALCMKISHSVIRRCNLESNQKLEVKHNPTWCGQFVQIRANVVHPYDEQRCKGDRSE